MIVVDTSAVLAIVWREPEEATFKEKLLAAGRALVSTATTLELQIVLAGSKALVPWPMIESLFRTYGIESRPFDERQATIARDAAMRFGKGRHKASLNFGDCFVYALAKTVDAPLLCKGNDFVHTDLKIA